MVFTIVPSSSSLQPRKSLISASKLLNFTPTRIPISSFRPKLFPTPPRFNLLRSSVSTKPLEADVTSATTAAVAAATDVEKFDWYAQWYPVMPVCDLDKRVPHAKKVLGIDVVVWWDQNENAWKVFDDMCPHRLAPLSEGRIDQWGRLQCVYHGWCFDGSGSCKLIPQSPPDGPPVHTNKRACVAVYPTVVHHGFVWFWPNSDPQYKDIFETNKPPFIPELDDPSFTTMNGSRDLPYGYEVLVENLMDPSHLPYAHYGLMQPSKRMSVIFICTPVSPGNSRLFWAFSRNFSIWTDKVIPRWMFHMETNLILDSDLYLLHVEEYKIKETGNWHKSCFVPTKADALVVGFRRWLKKYAGDGVDWRGKYSGDLPPTAPKEQLMDRYSSHVVNCSSCNSAYKGLNALEVILQVTSVGLIGIVAATNHRTLSTVARTGLGVLAIACFAASRWLAFFVHDNFRCHGYNHALPEKVMFLVRKLSPT
ncbi:Protochlorophyllide-dependent translocon component 52, chloroplastic [Linum perenne]